MASSDYSSSLNSESALDIEDGMKKIKLPDIDEEEDYSESSKAEDNDSFDIASADIFSLARNSKTQTLQTALKMGIDPNSKDKFGNTILIIGAQNGDKSIVKSALRYGAHINAANKNGNTALHYCYEYDYIELAEYLKSKGAMSKVNKMGIMPELGIRKPIEDYFDLKQYD
ncbi:unnamed protein product [Moneuplotes crassus]|uniref:Ankyrin repeat protein n=1 Tax=Euplotes crassus TaxID=5936 RepID=A0AAD1XWL2_EUPCR|nr:unnamed protein product [Moneuplotes crassus]